MKHHLSSFLLALLVLLGVSNSAVGQYSGSGTFEQITTLPELTDGYYVIAAESNLAAMTNTNAGKFFTRESISLTGNAVVNPASSIVWKIQFDGNQFTIYNEGSARFVSYSGSSNEAHVIVSATSNNQKWTATVSPSSVFSIANAAITNRLLQYNTSSPRFACYTNSQKNLLLFKLATSPSPTLSPISPVDFGTQNINTSGSQSINIKGSNLTGDLTVAVAGTGFSSTTTTVTQAEAETGKDVAIAFDPTAIGAATGTVTISGGGLTEDVVINLSGEGVLSIPALNPIADLVFGTVTVGGSSSMDIVVEGRNLSEDLTVTVAGDGFSGSATVTSAEAMADGGKTIAIAFAPTAAGAATGAVTISGSELSDAVIVNLTGEGKAASTAIPVFTEDFTSFVKGTPNGNASSSDVSTALDSYTTFPGWEGSKVYEAGGAVKMGGSTALGRIRTPAIDLSANGGTFIVSLKAMGWSGDATSFFITVNGNKTEVSGMNANSDYILSDFELTLTGGTSETVIGFEGKQISKSRFFIDDLIISQEKGDAPSITASNLSFGTVNINTLSTTTLTVVGANLSDDITVAVAGEGFSSTTTSVAKEGGDVAVSFAGTSKGEYAGTVTLTDGATTVTYDLTATVVDPADFIAGDIAALKAKGTTDKTSVFTLTGDVTFVFRGGRNIYVKDETGGLLIFDNSTPIITTEYAEGDVIAGGVTGTITEYNGLFEFIPTANTIASIENTGDVSAESVSIATLKNNVGKYESQLVNLLGVTFASGSFNTSAITNLGITQDGETIVCRNAFKTLDKTPAPVSNVRGFVSIFNNDIQIYPRSNDDLYIVVGCDPNMATTIKVMSQADVIVIDNVKEGEIIRVYNVGGVEVARQIATEARTTIALGKGLYIVKAGNSTVKVVR